ncbi:MAG: hypothetical protein CTY36_01825 [Methylocystis sp.]|jgi:hypothetical protein|nr:MAG: hypothetical protein CTY36_01825 [Methylocystis sp.]
MEDQFEAMSKVDLVVGIRANAVITRALATLSRPTASDGVSGLVSIGGDVRSAIESGSSSDHMPDRVACFPH